MYRTTKRRSFWILAVVALAAALGAAEAQAIDPSRAKASGEPGEPGKRQLTDPQRFDSPSPGERTRTDLGRSSPRITPDFRRPRWVLGIEADNTDTGVRVTRVVPDSAAWYAGLERRDVIVSVNGYQVGAVLGQLFPMDEELQLRADRLGRVRLLAQDHRTGRLVNLDVRLDRGGRPRPPRPDPVPPPRSAIRGTVQFRTLIRADQRGVVLVRLVDLSRPLSGLRPLAEQRVAVRGIGQVAFQLPVDFDSLPKAGRLALQAQLLVDDRQVEANDPNGYLLDRVDPRYVEIKLEPVRFDKRR